jgi:hypothetical protein
MVPLLLCGGGGQRRGRGYDALDRARHFERSQDRLDATIDQRERMADLDKRVDRRTRNQRRNRADAENDDQEPRTDSARSCSVVRQPVVSPALDLAASLRSDSG